MKRMPTQQGSTAASKAKKTSAAKTSGAEKKATKGATPDFKINRKWSGTVEPAVGQHVRVELPENALRGMAWQLLKLPHGVALDDSEIEAINPPSGLHNQNRIFNFLVNEPGEYTLQFHLARFGQGPAADTFKLKLSTKDN
jgi:Chagasin family peptidase inhibitor I42